MSEVKSVSDPEQAPHNVAFGLRYTKGLSKACVPQDRKGCNPLSFLFYSTTMETGIRIRFDFEAQRRRSLTF